MSSIHQPYLPVTRKFQLTIIDDSWQSWLSIALTILTIHWCHPPLPHCCNTSDYLQPSNFQCIECINTSNQILSMIFPTIYWLGKLSYPLTPPTHITIVVVIPIISSHQNYSTSIVSAIPSNYCPWQSQCPFPLKFHLSTTTSNRYLHYHGNPFFTYLCKSSVSAALAIKTLIAPGILKCTLPGTPVSALAPPTHISSASVILFLIYPWSSSFSIASAFLLTHRPGSSPKQTFVSTILHNYQSHLPTPPLPPTSLLSPTTKLPIDSQRRKTEYILFNVILKTIPYYIILK